MELPSDLDEWEEPAQQESPEDWSAESTVGYGMPPEQPIDDEKGQDDYVPFQLRI